MKAMEDRYRKYLEKAKSVIRTLDPKLSPASTNELQLLKNQLHEKQKIIEQVELFRIEKEKLDMEMAKWDDTGNDIIILAKQMCMIMMEMTDFTR